MTGQAARAKKHYTWADLCALPEGVRAEIIDGEFFDMSAAPALLHQQVLGELNDAFREHFKGEICQVFFAPVDVKLADDSVVEPDLLVVCDPHQLRGTTSRARPRWWLKFYPRPPLCTTDGARCASMPGLVSRSTGLLIRSRVWSKSIRWMARATGCTAVSGRAKQRRERSFPSCWLR